jgi:hypothetical protein
MKFRDLHVCQTERFSIGVETISGKYYLSVPVANQFVDYEEFYEISQSEFAAFSANMCDATGFVRQCRTREQDDRLMVKPGSDRGVAT